jgi:hypothetical protein
MNINFFSLSKTVTVNDSVRDNGHLGAGFKPKSVDIKSFHQFCRRHFYVVVVFKIHRDHISGKGTVHNKQISCPWAAWSDGAATSSHKLWGNYLTQMPHALDVSCYV